MLINVEAERGRYGMSKEEVAKALDITTTTYLNYVRKGNPPTLTLLKMHEMWGCSVDYLLGLTDQRTSWPA